MTVTREPLSLWLPPGLPHSLAVRAVDEMLEVSFFCGRAIGDLLEVGVECMIWESIMSIVCANIVSPI